ncbi:MAG: PepSY-associated TM helix domain-containing protein [Micropepsaceae bacterium]
MRNVIFQLHWFFGITAGLVLAIVGATGAILSFEDEILEWMNPGILTVDIRSDVPALSPQQLIDAVKASDPAAVVNSATVAEPGHPASVGLAPAGGQGRGRQILLDPYTGAPLGEPAGRGFFQFNEQLHRNLVIPGAGKIIVGISTIILIGLALSGLYLRWPILWTRLRVWFMPHFGGRGRALWWSIHAVFGTWVLLLYLVMSLTGLWWSFEWYRNGSSLLLTGKPAVIQQGGGGGGARGETPPPPLAVSLNPAWTVFLQTSGGAYQSASFTLPRKEGDPVQVRYLPAGAAHNRANDQLKLDPATGAVLSHERFTDKTTGEHIYGSVFPLHSGSYFGFVGLALWGLASLIMPVFFVTGWLLYLGRRKAKAKRLARLKAQPAK